MLVKDKRRDIAILRTVGARRGAVLRVFLMCGAAIGVLGTTAGLLLGLVFCAYIEEIRQFLQWLTSTQLFPAEVYFLAQLPAVVDGSEVAQVVGDELRPVAARRHVPGLARGAARPGGGAAQ